jgi:hypothetical protein
MFIESPDEIETDRGSAHWTEPNNITFMVDTDGELVAGQGLSHNNVQNVLYYAHNWDGKSGDISKEVAEEKYISKIKKIKIMAYDVEGLIKKAGILTTNNISNNVRSKLDEWAVGRMFYNINTVSMWNDFNQLNSKQKDAIVRLLVFLGKDVTQFDFEVNPEKYGDTGVLLDHDEFMSNMKIDSPKKDKEKELSDQMHTMEPRMKKLVKGQLGANDKPSEALRKKKEDRAVWNRTVRGENFERIYDGLTENTLKYYAFDWDDNLLYMPTEIYLKEDNGDKFAVGTSQYAHFKKYLINKEKFKTDGKLILGLHEDAFMNFRVEGDDVFIAESLIAETGPAWSEFVTAVNNGRIFSIITARGHSTSAIQTAVTEMIKVGKDGLNQYLCIDSLRHMHDNSKSDNEYSDEMLLERYLDKLCKYYPTTYGKNDGEDKCHLYKEDSLRLFVEHVESAFGNMDSEFRSRVSNNFIIGFSDDDTDNVNHIVENFNGDSVEVYDTSTGTPLKVESRYKEWLEDGDVELLFHTTPISNEFMIRDTGLIPSEHRDGEIYLASSRDAALGYYSEELSHMDTPEDCLLCIVDPMKLKEEALEQDGDDYLYFGKIPPNIIKFERVTWKNLTNESHHKSRFKLWRESDSNNHIK